MCLGGDVARVMLCVHGVPLCGVDICFLGVLFWLFCVFLVVL